MSRDDFPPFDSAQGALSHVEARTAEAGRGRPVPARRVHGSGKPFVLERSQVSSGFPSPRLGVYSLALCTLTSAGFLTPGLLMRWRPVGRFVFVNGGIATALPVLADV